MPGERAQSVQKRITSVRWKYSKLCEVSTVQRQWDWAIEFESSLTSDIESWEKRRLIIEKDVCKQWITPESSWYPSPFLLPTDPHINYVAETRCLCWLLSIFLPILGFLLFLGPNSSFSGFKWYKASSTGNNPALVAPLSLPHHFPSVVKQAQRVFSLIQQMRGGNTFVSLPFSSLKFSQTQQHISPRASCLPVLPLPSWTSPLQMKNGINIYTVNICKMKPLFVRHAVSNSLGKPLQHMLSSLKSL